MDLEDFKYGGTNITAFRLVDPNNPEVLNVVKSWMLGEKRFPTKKFPINPLIKVLTTDCIQYSLLIKQNVKAFNKFTYNVLQEQISKLQQFENLKFQYLCY